MATSSPENPYLESKILLRIALFCDQETLLSFCRVCRLFNKKLTPFLYRHVILEEAPETPYLLNRRCVSQVPASLTVLSNRALSLAKMLLMNPKLHVQSLEVSVSSWTDSAGDILEEFSGNLKLGMLEVKDHHDLHRAVAIIILISEHLTTLKVTGLHGLSCVLSQALKDSSLDSLYYYSKDTTGEFFADLISIPNQRLLLADWQEFDADAISHEQKNMNLKCLELTRTLVRNDLIDMIAACPNLIGLRIEYHVDKDGLCSDLLEDLFVFTPNLVHLHLDVSLDLSFRALDRPIPNVPIDVSVPQQLETLTVPLGWIGFDDPSIISKLPPTLTYLHGTYTSARFESANTIHPKERPGLTISSSLGQMNANIASIGAHRRLRHMGDGVQSFERVGREESQHVVL